MGDRSIVPALQSLRIPSPKTDEIQTPPAADPGYWAVMETVQNAQDHPITGIQGASGYNNTVPSNRNRTLDVKDFPSYAPGRYPGNSSENFEWSGFDFRHQNTTGNWYQPEGNGQFDYTSDYWNPLATDHTNGNNGYRYQDQYPGPSGAFNVSTHPQGAGHSNYGEALGEGTSYDRDQRPSRYEQPKFSLDDLEMPSIDPADLSLLKGCAFPTLSNCCHEKNSAIISLLQAGYLKDFTLCQFRTQLCKVGKLVDSSETNFVTILHCDRCEQSFTSREWMEEHMSSIHQFGPVHGCSACGAIFPRSVGLEKHLATHLDCLISEGYKCDCCGLRFRSKTEFLKHKRAIREKRPSLRVNRPKYWSTISTPARSYWK